MIVPDAVLTADEVRRERIREGSRSFGLHQEVVDEIVGQMSEPLRSEIRRHQRRAREIAEAEIRRRKRRTWTTLARELGLWTPR